MEAEKKSINLYTTLRFIHFYNFKFDLYRNHSYSSVCILCVCVFILYYVYISGSGEHVIICSCYNESLFRVYLRILSTYSLA